MVFFCGKGLRRCICIIEPLTRQALIQGSHDELDIFLYFAFKLDANIQL